MILQPELLAERLRQPAPKPLPLENLRPAAVLIPLFRADGEDWLLLTRRTAELKHHSGEISFPGGGSHDEDASLRETALRETSEEMGIAPQDVTIHGQLDDFISVYGYRVTPYVGSFPAPYAYTPNPAEIAEVIELPLRRFLEAGVWHQEDWQHQGRRHPVDFYQVDDHLVWGLTATMLRHLLQRCGLIDD